MDLARLRDQFAPAWSHGMGYSCRARAALFHRPELFASFPPATLAWLPALHARHRDAAGPGPGQQGATAGSRCGCRGSKMPACSISCGTCHAHRPGSTRCRRPRASVTVYGIWLGHVYHWHIVTAAMQMTLYNTLQSDHPGVSAGSAASELPDPVRRIPAAAVGTDRAADFGHHPGIPGTDQQLRHRARLPRRTTRQRRCRTTALPRPIFPGKHRGTLSRRRLVARLWNDRRIYVTAFVDNTYANDALVAEDCRVAGLDARGGRSRRGQRSRSARDAIAERRW